MALEDRILLNYLTSLGQDNAKVITAFRNLRPLFRSEAGMEKAAKLYERHTGRAHEPYGRSFMVHGSTLPWAFYVTPGLDNTGLPDYAIHVTSLEVAYIELAKGHKDDLVNEVMRQWEAKHAKPIPSTIRQSIEQAGWKITEAKSWSTAAAESHWKSATKLTGKLAGKIRKK